MRKINIIFDYIYYRLNKFYYKRDKEDGITAILGITMLQTLLISHFVFIIMKMIYTKEEIQSFNWLKVVGIVLFIALEIYNHFRYKGKYSILKERWKNESKKQTFQRGFIVLAILIVPWITVIMVINMM